MINNFSNRQAYGDIFVQPTSAVDAIAARLVRDQQQREMEKRQRDRALDDEFAKNVAGVKSIDIPDITKAYSDFKQAHIALQRKGNKATPQDQMDVMIKKANAFSEIAASKEDKEYWGMRAKDGKNNKRYNPNYQTIISEGLNTPTKKRNRDLDDDKLLYKYAMPNIDDDLKFAVTRDTPDPETGFEIEAGVDENDPLKDKVEVYGKRINPPNTMYNRLFFKLGSRADNEGFTRNVLDNTPDDEKQKIRTAYEVKTSDPNFIKLYGKVEPFPASAANTELGQATALKVMEAFVNLPIEKVKDKSVLNADRNKTRALDDWFTKFNAGNREWDRRRPLRFADSMALMLANKAAGQPPTDTGYISDEVAEEVGVNEIVELDGKTRDVKIIYTDKTDPQRLKIITSNGAVKPIPIKQKDGSIKMGYYQDRRTGDWEGLGKDGKPAVISREAAKDRYVKEVSPTKFKTQVGTKASENTKGDKKTTTKPKSDPLGLGF